MPSMPVLQTATVTTTIRPAQTSDAPQVAILLGELGYPAGRGEVIARLGYWLQDSQSRLLVAEVNGNVSGVAAMHAIPLLERTGRRARLVALVVGQSVRAQGVGRALMKAVEDAARDLGCRDLEITSARNRTVAQRFYADLGYHDVSDHAARFMKLLEF
jgi:N-acetylglutamate synthase-like GNAT family acetyltransferase